MGHLKEPKGVDFIINSRALTKDEELTISEFIKSYKGEKTAKGSSVAKKPKRKVPV